MSYFRPFQFENDFFLDSLALLIVQFCNQFIYLNSSKFKCKNNAGPHLKLKIQYLDNFFENFTDLYLFL